MINCLVTKLKGLVDNDDLQRFGYGYLKVNTTETSRIRFSSGTHIKSLGGGRMSMSSDMSNSFTETTITGDYYNVYFSAGNYKVEVTGKYDVVAKVFLMDNVGICLDDSLKNWVFYSFNDEVSSRSYNISDINQGTVGINIGKANLSGDLSHLNNITTLDVINFNTAVNVTGSIVSAAKNILLKELQVESTQATGTVEGFAQAQVSAGRTSGTCLVKIGGTSATYNGNTVNVGTTITITYNSSLPNGYSISMS